MVIDMGSVSIQFEPFDDYGRLRWRVLDVRPHMDERVALEELLLKIEIMAPGPVRQFYLRVANWALEELRNG